ncbi:sensor histidine kinase [Paenibacillus sp. LPE1-1-1.1]|uniref:sensor histidine kinase n=1 Tax=Paenibacillus sp. LPE1-1-1.1 TaxID=3135230 RepID=UPI00341CBF37
MYTWSYSNASQEISRNTPAQLSSYIKDLHREIEWLEVQQLDMLQDIDLNKIAVAWDKMDRIEQSQSMNEVLNRLTSIKNNSTYTKDIFIHCNFLNKTVSTLNGVSTYDYEKFDYFLHNAGKNKSRLINWNDSLHLGSAKFGGKNGVEPLYIVQIELDMEKLQESLHQVNLYPESRVFLRSEALGFTLSGDEEANLVEGRSYQLYQASYDEQGLSVVTYVPEEQVKKTMRKFNLWAWLFSLASIVAVVSYSYSSYKLVYQPMQLLVQRFRKMEEGAPVTPIEHEKKDEFGFLYNKFNQALLQMQTLIDQDHKQKLMMNKAELKQLQSQMNPQFMYNSFFILNALAKTGDFERIERFANLLGEYFRFVTRNGEDSVLLSEEIRHSRLYTEIQDFRFSRRLRVEFNDLPKEMGQMLVPRLTVRLIIESAYEHSLEKMPADGLLRVSFEMKQDEALVIVEDNGNINDNEIEALKSRLAGTAESYEITGKINILRRILLTYGDGIGLFVSRSELNGLKFVIRIKLPEMKPVG